MMKTGLVLSAIFLAVVSGVVLLVMFAGSLLGIPLSAPEAVKMVPPAPAVVKVEAKTITPPPRRQPQYVEVKQFEMAQEPEPYYYDNPYAETTFKTVDGLRFETIILTLDNGNTISFDNNTIETDADYTAYSYIGLYPSINTHILRFSKKDEHGFLLVDTKTGNYTVVHGRLLKVPESPVMLVQENGTLNIFAKTENGFFHSQWAKPFTDAPILAVAKEQNGTLLLKYNNSNSDDNNGTDYLYERFMPDNVSMLWQGNKEANSSL